jgi:hypothetical protein
MRQASPSEALMVVGAWVPLVDSSCVLTPDGQNTGARPNTLA